jgi:putative 4-mercaptohistidine N1-methyltranferase
VKVPYYESDAALAQYLLLHYGTKADIAPDGFVPKKALSFPLRCVTDTVDWQKMRHRARALEVGCAVGRSSFELARRCAEVIGVDFSQRFIAAARRLRTTGEVEIERVDQGDLTSRVRLAVPPDIDRNRVRFEQGDAQDLRKNLGAFDVVLAANLLCRLRHPRRFLDRLPALVRPGGILVLTTPSTWKQIHTPRSNWIGGCIRDGREVRTLDGLKDLLDPAFRLRRRLDLPLVIREHERKYEYIVAEATVWRRSDGM